METQVILSKKEYDVLIEHSNQLSKFKKDKGIYVSLLDVNHGRHYLSGVLYINKETETIKILLDNLKDKQGTIDYIAKQRDDYKEKLDKKWWQF
jgi:hypothetical protein